MNLLFEQVKKVVDVTDPEGLLARGCPRDEYDSETQELVARLREAADEAAADVLARDVFGRRFSSGGARRLYRAGLFDELAKALVLARASL